MSNAMSNLSAETLAKEACDRLTGKGLLKTKPAFIRTDREAKLAEIFGKANLDGGTLQSIGGRISLEMHLLSVTAGEACAWLGNVINELTEIVLDGAFQARSGHEEMQPRALANHAVLTTLEGTPRLELLRSEDLASRECDRLVEASPTQNRVNPWPEAVAARVCTRLVEKGLLKTKPAFVRIDREANICKLLRKAGFEGAALTAYSDGRSLHLRLLGALNGDYCAWLDNAVAELVELSQGTDVFDEVDPAPSQKLPVTGERKGIGVVDTPRSMALCSTCDGVPEIPFSAAPTDEKEKQGYLQLVHCRVLHNNYCRPWQDLYGTSDSQDFDFLFGALPEHPGPDLQDLELVSPRGADSDTGSQDTFRFQ